MIRNRIPSYFQLEKYGISPADVVRLALHCEPEAIRSSVILMPSWGPETFAEVAEIREIASSVWDIEYQGQVVSLVRSGIGAPMAGDAMLALTCTPCQNVLFTGSMAGLRGNMSIGDLCVVEKSICGDGFSRYLDSAILPGDCFLKPTEPDEELRKRVQWHAQQIGRDCVFRSKKATVSDGKGRPFGAKQATASE